MNQRIIYKTDEGGVAVVIPTGELSVTETAKKDVPGSGTPYWIVDVSDIPSDRTFRESWELDESIEPTGVTP